MNFRVTLAYDGSDFLGWQRQSNKRSVQEEMEVVISKISKCDVKIFGSGRTDAKVHALAQVFNFESNLNMDASAWFRALTSLVPKDILIKEVIRVQDDFHAQYHAVAKSYEYRLNLGTYNPFMRKYEFQFCKDLDLEMMLEATRLFLGTHDFTSFNATELSVVANQIRTISRFDIEQNGSVLTFSISGNGFLRYMVRMLVAACVEVGLGKMDLITLKEVLERKDKRAFARNIDPCGLYLCEVIYDDGWVLYE